MLAEQLRFFVYYSHQKISHLYRQLPESRVVAHRASVNLHDRAECGFRMPHREEDHRTHMAHAELDGARTHYREACFEKNDMYQLEQVLCRLRKTGQLRGTPQGACQGEYLEIQGCFLPQEKCEAPQGSLWLAAPGGEGDPAVRLLCGKPAFCGETEEAWREIWACGQALPLWGVMLCLGFQGDCVCGTPLFLAL